MKTTNWIIALATVVNVIIFAYSIHNPFAKENIRIERQSELGVNQDWGKIVFNQYMDFKNIGDKECYISKIVCLVQNKEVRNLRFLYHANSYSTDFIGIMPLLNFTLLPGQSFTGNLIFSRLSTNSEYEIESNFKNKIYEYLDSCYTNHEPSVCLDVNSFLPMQKYIENKITEIREGEYNCIIQVYKNDEKIPFYTKCFYFVLYNADLKRLSNSLSSLKKGFGIFINTDHSIISGKEEGTWAITTDIENKDLIELLEREIRSSN